MAFALMPYAIANARIDENSTVDLNPTVLSAVFGEPIDKIESAIRYLCSPDPNSRSPDCQGKRLVQCGPGPFRYRVVNLQKYRDDALTEDRREYWRQYRKWERSGRKGRFVFTVNDVNGSELFNSVQSTDADADADADKSTIKGSKYAEARTVLHFLNEATGRHFRELDTNLAIIASRLSEPEVTLEGVKQMISRQCRRWKGTEQEEYLRPETLFRKSKFDGYYAAKDQPVQNAVSKVKEDDSATVTGILRRMNKYDC